jgi:hypothetical protein
MLQMSEPQFWLARTWAKEIDRLGKEAVYRDSYTYRPRPNEHNTLITCQSIRFTISKKGSQIGAYSLLLSNRDSAGEGAWSIAYIAELIACFHVRSYPIPPPSTIKFHHCRPNNQRLPSSTNPSMEGYCIMETAIPKESVSNLARSSVGRCHGAG